MNHAGKYGNASRQKSLKHMNQASDNKENKSQ